MAEAARLGAFWEQVKDVTDMRSLLKVPGMLIDTIFQYIDMPNIT